MVSKSGCNVRSSTSAFSRAAASRISSTAFTRSSKSAACSFAFLIAIVSTILAMSGYFLDQVSSSSSDLGSLISCLVALSNCFWIVFSFSVHSCSFCCMCLRRSPYRFLKLFSSALLGSCSCSTTSVLSPFCSAINCSSSSSSFFNRSSLEYLRFTKATFFSGFTSSAIIVSDILLPSLGPP